MVAIISGDPELERLSLEFVKELEAALDEDKPKVRDAWEKRFIEAGYRPFLWNGSAMCWKAES